MANTIRITRSNSTNTPAALAQGELAFSESDSGNSVGELFIGIAGPGVQKIATLTGAAAAEPNDSAQNNQTITTGLGIDGAEAGDSGNITISFDPNELVNTSPVTADYIVFEDVTDSAPKKALLSTFPLGLFSNDQNWNNYTHPHHSGQVISVNDGAQSLHVSAITAQPASGALIGTDTLLTNDGGVLSESTFNQLVTYFNANLSFPAEADTLALVTGRGATTAVESTFSGGLLMADSNINRAVLEDFGVTHQTPTVSTNAVTINCTLGNSVLIDLDPATADVTVTLSNPPASGTYGELSIAVVMGTPAHGITWPGTVVWMGGGAPTLTTTNDVVDLIHLFTVDGGTIWFGTYSLAAAGASGTLSGLTDVTLTTPADADMLLYDTGTSMWRDATMSGDASIIDDGTITVSNSAALGGTAAASYALIANAVMEADTATTGWGFVLDQDTLSDDSDTKLATQQSIKAYVDNAVVGGMTHKGGYNATTNIPALDTGSPTLVKGDLYTVTTGGTFFTVELEIGDTLIADVDSVDAANVGDWTIVQTNIGAATEAVPGYIELATQGEMDTATDDARAVTPLKYASSTIDGGTF